VGVKLSDRSDAQGGSGGFQQVAELLVGLPKIMTAVSENAPAWAEQLHTAMQSINTLKERISRELEPLKEVITHWSRIEVACKRLDGAGWLPHDTVPMQLIAEIDCNHEKLSHIIEDHYRSNWKIVKESFLRNLDFCEIDEEAKATFLEALNAHEYGLYRVPPRLLFPEIERVSRIEVHGGRINGLASQRELRKISEDLSLFDVNIPGLYTLRLYDRFVAHMYVKVEDDISVNAMSADAVPNRHAALHGLVVYATMKSSINALIMTDFVFQVVTVIKRASRVDV